MPQGRPASAKVAKLRTASASAPARSGQGPAREAGSPRVAGFVSVSSAPWRRRSAQTVTAAIAAKSASETAMPGRGPSVCTSETGRIAGSDSHQSKWTVASTEPTTKKRSVTSMRALPPPAVNSVPEAQPPPICMPMPNRKAPTTTPVESGETRPLTGLPNSVPAPSAGKNRTTASASIAICARRPRPRRSRMKTRQAEVKPKAAW